jgi:probable rRNA maturation factor
MRPIKQNIVNIEMKKKIEPGFDLKAAVLSVLKWEKKQGLEINLVLVDNKYIKEINLEYRLKNRITDVISFESPEGGDIFISADRAKEQAREYGASFDEEMCRLLIHGTLHVLGYDHIKKDDEKNMKPKEKKYFKAVMGAGQ